MTKLDFCTKTKNLSKNDEIKIATTAGDEIFGTVVEVRDVLVLIDEPDIFGDILAINYENIVSVEKSVRDRER